jgi:hypothetical protein
MVSSTLVSAPGPARGAHSDPRRCAATPDSRTTRDWNPFVLLLIDAKWSSERAIHPVNWRSWLEANARPANSAATQAGCVLAG